MTVVKVGGSLLADRGDLRRVAAAIGDRRRDGGPLLVIASALKGVTDLLDQAATQARDRHLHDGHLGETLERLRRRHVEMAADVADDGSALSRVQGGSTRWRRWSAPSAPPASSRRHLRPAAVLRRAAERHPAGRRPAGRRAGRGRWRRRRRACGPRGLARGIVRPAGSAPGFRRLRRGLRDRFLVLTGFYGVGADGGVVLFGRGGSDDTACAVAAGLDAGRLELWKDVPGLMSADPREVRGARVIHEVRSTRWPSWGPMAPASSTMAASSPCAGAPPGARLRRSRAAAPPPGPGWWKRLQRGAARVVALASRRGDNGSPALIGVVGDGVADHPEIRSRVLACLIAAGARGDLVAEPSGRSGRAAPSMRTTWSRSQWSARHFFASPERS